MVSFKAFVEGINNAIIAANENLMARHENLLDTYFEPLENPGKKGETDHKKHSTLRAKSLCLQYPQHTESGIKMVDVDIPLITLVPISFSKIDQVKLVANFDLEVIENELQIHFPSRSHGTKGKINEAGKENEDDGKINSGHLEITLSPSEGPEGLKRVIESYEKVLMAQMPH